MSDGKGVAKPNLHRETTCEGQLSLCLRHQPFMSANDAMLS